MKKLDAMKVEYVRAAVEDGGIEVDPDGYMIEICNCQNLPVLPIFTCPLNQPSNRKNQAQPFYSMFSSHLFQFFHLFIKGKKLTMYIHGSSVCFFPW